MRIKCLGLVLFSTLLFCIEVGCQETAFDKIERNIHYKSWYEGCPASRNLFDTAFKEVEKGTSKWARLVDYYSGCLIEENREIEAINFLNEALNISPTNHAFFSGLGTAYMRLKDDENAEKYFLKSITIKPNHDSYYKLAFIHYKNGVRLFGEENANKRHSLLKKAEEEIKKAIELYSKETHVSPYGETGNISLLAQIYSAQGKVEKAISIYRDIIEKVEKDTGWDKKRQLFALTEFKFSLGQLLWTNNSREEGLKLMNRAIDIAPTDNLKKIKKMLLESTINPPKDDSEFKSRYPQLKENTFIPLY